MSKVKRNVKSKNKLISTILTITTIIINSNANYLRICHLKTLSNHNSTFALAFF